MRRSWAVVLVGVLAGALAAGGCRKPEPGGAIRGPGLNVLLITLDTTRADALSCYGNRSVKTPALDRLAEKGTLFTQCTSCVPITLPSHASILTATYPFVHGTRLNGKLFADEGNVTLPEILRGAGYVTGAQVAAVVVEAMWGIDQGFDTFAGMPDSGRSAGAHAAGLRLMSYDPADRVCDRAIAWLDDHASERFLLWVHFFDPHVPYEPPEPFRSQIADPYLGEVAFMDEQIGRLLDRLSAIGLDGKTLVVVVGDHGEAFAQHGERTHSYFVYDSTLHVPLMFRCPGRIPAGRRIEAQTRIVDVTPTILDFLGMPPKGDAQGTSLLPLMSGRQDDLQLAAYAESMAAHLDLGYAQLRCLRAGGWKYIHAPTPELYNVVSDPGETMNLAPQYPALVADLRGQLGKLIAESEPAVSGGEDVSPLDPETAERLASLGYIGGAIGHDMGDELQGFENLTGHDPKDRLDLHMKFITAKMRAGAGHPEEAIPILESLIRTEGNNPSTLNLLADLRREQGDLEAAIGLYQRVLTLQPKRAIARYHLGKMFGELGRTSEAIEHLRLAAEHMPRYADARAYLALALASQGNLDEAVEQFERALALDPDHEEAHIGLSGALQALGRTGEAVQVLRRGLARVPSSIQLANNLAWALATAAEDDLRDGAEAVRLAEDVVRRIARDHAETLDTLAAAYACAGRFEEAAQTARRAEELATANGRTELAGQIAARAREYEAGRPYVESASVGAHP